MSNGSKVLIYLSLYLSISISRIVDSNPQGFISSVLIIDTYSNIQNFVWYLAEEKVNFQEGFEGMNPRLNKQTNIPSRNLPLDLHLCNL